MLDYEEAYLFLFNRLTDLIEELKKVQQKAEETAVFSCKSAVTVIATEKWDD